MELIKKKGTGQSYTLRLFPEVREKLQQLAKIRKNGKLAQYICMVLEKHIEDNFSEWGKVLSENDKSEIVSTSVALTTPEYTVPEEGIFNDNYFAHGLETDAEGVARETQANEEIQKKIIDNNENQKLLQKRDQQLKLQNTIMTAVEKVLKAKGIC